MTGQGCHMESVETLSAVMIAISTTYHRAHDEPNRVHVNDNHETDLRPDPIITVNIFPAELRALKKAIRDVERCLRISRP